MGDRKIVNSILLFNKKYEDLVKQGKAIRYNNELHPTLQKQLDSVVAQAKNIG